MLPLFIQNIETKNLFSKNNKLLLGVSGGKDSMVLATLLEDTGYNFSVAHCNFCLREKEADLEEEFVRNYFEKKNIKVFSIRFNTKEYASEHNCSIQMAARELRYEWFNELRRSNGFDYVLTAHHLNDNIETFLINALRGSGLNGLKGIPEKAGHIVRPLLFASSAQLKSYQEQNQLPYKEDSSNKEVKYLRNKLRHQVLPLLKEINPAIEETFRKEFIYLNQANNLLEETLSLELNSISKTNTESLHVNLDALLASKHPELLLHHLLKNYSFSSSIVEQLLESIKLRHSGKLFLSNSHTCIIDRVDLIIKPNNTIENNLTEFEIDESEETILVPLKLSFSYLKGSSITKGANIACLDFDKLTFPLTIRKWRTGDFFRPMGMNGKKKLSDFFGDLKYSIFQKQEQWLLTSNNEIVWVIGKRCDDRFKLTENTARTLMITLENGE